MKLTDLAGLIPPEAMAVMRFLESVGAGLESEGVSVTDLGWDFRAGRAEMVFMSPDGRRLEMTVREMPHA